MLFKSQPSSRCGGRVAGRAASGRGWAPAPLAAGYLDGTLGELLLKPWFDQAALWYIATRYLPLSRAWAAATLAKGDPETFQQEVGWKQAPSLRWRLALDEVARRRSVYDDATAAWDDASPEVERAAATSAATPPALMRICCASPRIAETSSRTNIA